MQRIPISRPVKLSALVLAFLLLLATSVATAPFLYAAKSKTDDSSVPLGHALAALQAGKRTEADRWLELTAKDFPDHLNGYRALILQLIDRVAKELSGVKMARHLNEGGQLDFGAKQRWHLLSQSYEERALDFGAGLYAKAQTLFERDGRKPAGELLPIKLELNLNLNELEVGKLRERLRKGEWLEPAVRTRLEQGEWLNNYLGFLAEVLAIGDGKLLSGSYSGTVRRPALYLGVGARLFILGQRGNKPEYLALARQYFERVLQLTTATPYQPDRQRALDFLALLPPSQPK